MARSSPGRARRARLPRALGLAMPSPLPRKHVRSAAGAGLSLLLCASLATLPEPVGGAGLALVAPLGATAVLVFAVANSPLAQPWSAVLGTTLSALVALAVIRVAPAPPEAGLAVGCAVLAMMATGSLHPPGGAWRCSWRRAQGSPARPASPSRLRLWA